MDYEINYLTWDVERNLHWKLIIRPFNINIFYDYGMIKRNQAGYVMSYCLHLGNNNVVLTHGRHQLGSVVYDSYGSNWERRIHFTVHAIFNNFCQTSGNADGR